VHYVRYVKFLADSIKSGTRAAFAALVLFCLLIAASCSTSTRQLFFDIQPPTAAEIAEKNRQENARRGAVVAEGVQQYEDSKSFGSAQKYDNQPRPEIESATTWEQVVELLPKDYKKKTDWAAAVEQGLIRPRTGMDHTSEYVKAFQYDFIMPSEKPKNEAYFPHSAHTAWLNCKNCHMTIYPYKRNPATMKEMRNGASCGTCHGKNNVAFSLSNCKRCHLKR
jgi:c(7)-type cytochrome triheme protein